MNTTHLFIALHAHFFMGGGTVKDISIIYILHYFYIIHLVYTLGGGANPYRHHLLFIIHTSLALLHWR